MVLLAVLEPCKEASEDKKNIQRLLWCFQRRHQLIGLHYEFSTTYTCVILHQQVALNLSCPPSLLRTVSYGRVGSYLIWNLLVSYLLIYFCSLRPPSILCFVTWCSVDNGNVLTSEWFILVVCCCAPECLALSGLNSEENWTNIAAWVLLRTLCYSLLQTHTQDFISEFHTSLCLL